MHENPLPQGGPFLVATRREGDDRPTIMSYGHGDVVRGYDDQWHAGLSPWMLEKRDGRWYGRGSADNKGQHTINLAALQAVLETRGELGFNAVLLIETGEETGSPGLREFCAANKALFEADVFHRLGRPAHRAGTADHIHGFARRVELRSGRRPARRWPPFRQLGRTAGQPGRDPGARALPA